VNFLKSVLRAGVGALLVLLCAAAAQLTAQGQAQAQQPLLIVPFDQEGVDQVFYDKLMEQVRADAGKSQNYDALDAQVAGKMEDLLFEVGCAEVTSECLQLLGESYGAESIMWGQIWKNDRVTLLEIKLFDVLAGSYTIDPPVERSFETSDAEQLRKSILGEFQQIFFPYTGEITVTANEPSVDIFFDGEKVGNTSEGPVVLTGRPLGEHIIIAREGDREVTQTVVLLFDDPQKMEIDMSLADIGQPGFAYTGTVVSGSISGLFLGAGVLFAVLTQGQSDAAKDEAANPMIDVNKANDILNTGDTYQTLQYICLGVGGAALISTAVFYFFESSGSDAPAPGEEAGTASWFGPMVLPGGGGAAFGGRF
jgi:hypothetical protein